MTGLAVLSDAPAYGGQDRLQFTRYVDPIVSVLANPDSSTPFTIGVLGAWGTGKSSVLTMVDERLRERNAERFMRVEFNPWVYRREPNIIQPLLRALHDTLLADGRKRFAETATRIASITATLTTDALLGAVSAGRVSLEKLTAARAQYARVRNQVDSELRTLRAALRSELAALDSKGVRVVFFIDDLDRCEPDQIIDLLESIKLFLDVPGVFVLLAISKELVDRAVAIKYHNFGFDQDGLVDLGDEYLEKMIQLPLYLLPLDTRDVRALVADLAAPEVVAAHGALLESILLPNPRKIKRVLNFLTVTTAIVHSTPGLSTGLRGDVIVRLAVLRVQAPRLFAAALNSPRMFDALERVYAGTLALTEAGFKTAYKVPEGPALLREVEPHYRRQTQLKALFANAGFVDIGDTINEYLTLFGGRAE